MNTQLFLFAEDEHAFRAAIQGLQSQIKKLHPMPKKLQDSQKHIKRHKKLGPHELQDSQKHIKRHKKLANASSYVSLSFLKSSKNTPYNSHEINQIFKKLETSLFS